MQFARAPHSIGTVAKTAALKSVKTALLTATSPSRGRKDAVAARVTAVL